MHLYITQTNILINNRNKTIIKDSRNHSDHIRELFDETDIMKYQIDKTKSYTDLNTVDILVLYIHLKNLLMCNVLFIYVVCLTLICALTEAGSPIPFIVAVSVVIAIIGLYVYKISINLKDNLKNIKNYDKMEEKENESN